MGADLLDPVELFGFFVAAREGRGGSGVAFVAIGGAVFSTGFSTGAGAGAAIGAGAGDTAVAATVSGTGVSSGACVGDGVRVA